MQGGATYVAPLDVRTHPEPGFPSAGTRGRVGGARRAYTAAVQVGILLIFQNYLGRGRDEDVVAAQMQLAELAEELGFDKVWAVEHHFTDYAACPDNVAFLSWLAGRTRKIGLATGAVIVPWNDPLRVAEKIALLDHLSGGRAVLGLGRGLARVEYEHFGIDMSTSRARFDEGARMILDGLEKGFVEGTGPWYPQLRTEIRPRPLRGIRDRFYCVGMSPDSVEQAAALGGRLMTFTQQLWQSYAEGPLRAYRESYRRHHGAEAPPPLTGDLLYCHADAGAAEAKGLEYMTDYFLTIARHYELMGEHFKSAKGYEYYATAGELFRQVGLEPAARAYCSVNTFGTPEQVLAKLRWRHELLGGYELSVIPHYGGMAAAEAEASLRLFAEAVLPEVHRW
jgi:alkanesulfonate monooxygenase SsuD/methylene tetrahydromethanopterin reductase-like flavin-dependent oxidoreductase (luciferase family)